MRKKIICISALGVLMGSMMSCKEKSSSNEGAQTEQTQASADLTTLKVDSVVVDLHWAFTDESMREYVDKDVLPGLKCIIDVPSSSQSEVLAKAVMEWVSKNAMGGVYSGDVMDVNSMAKAYADHIQKNSEEGGMGPDSQTEFSVRKVYENAQVVTFLYSGYDYAFGAAHGMPYIIGATFCKSDGKLLDAGQLVRKDADLQAFLKSGLKTYFEAKTDDELGENLMMDESNSIDKLPAPQTAPWIDERGVVLVYQSYEISSYAAGQPEVVIPVKEAEKVLTPEAYEMLK